MSASALPSPVRVLVLAALGTALALGATACPARAPKVDPPAAGALVHAAAEAEGALFLQGFDVRWRAHPHRLRRLSFGALGSAREAADALSGVLFAEVRGGTWASGQIASDTPSLSLRYGAVASPDVRVLSGAADLALQGRLSQRRNPDHAAAGTVVIEVPVPPSAPGDAIAAWITGFEMTSGPAHPNGYTPHGISVWLHEPERVPGAIRMQVEARLEAAPVPDRRQQLKVYGANVRVHYALVVAQAASTRRFGVHTAIDHGIEPVKVTSRKGPARFPVTVQLPEGGTAAIGGLSGFSFLLDEPGPVAGRYMRALTAGLEDERYDRARGTYDAVVALRFANSGQLARRVQVDAAATFTVLQLERLADVRSGRWIPPSDGQRHRVAYPEMTLQE